MSLQNLIIKTLVGAQWLISYEGDNEDFEIYLYGLSEEDLLDVYDKVRDASREASRTLDQLGR